MMHEARKQVRKLRYTEESFASEAGGGALKRLQGAMGLERDLTVLETRAQEQGLVELSRRLHSERDLALKSIPRLAKGIHYPR